MNRVGQIDTEVKEVMKKMHVHFIKAGEKSQAKTVKRADSTGFTGMAYDVDHRRFHVAYEDPATGRIRIECRCDQIEHEHCMSMSAA